MLVSLLSLCLVSASAPVSWSLKERSQPLLPATDGRVVYRQACAMCHGPHGEGMPAFGLPLNDARWLSRCRADELVAVLLDGMQGPIPGNPTSYPVMPALRAWLTDEQMAGVASYVLQVHAHRTERVSVSSVRQLRDRQPVRAVPWTLSELSKLPSTTPLTPP